MEEKQKDVGKAIAVIFVIIIAVILVCAVVANEDKLRETSSKESVITELQYDNHGLSFTYPSNYAITTDDVEDGFVDVLCEVKGTKIGQIEISYVALEDLKMLTAQDVESISCSTLEGMKDRLRGNILYKNVIFDPIKRGYMGKYNCYQIDYTMSIMSVTTNGSAKIMVSDTGHMIITVSMYENEKDKEIIESIENTIKFE